MPIKNYEENFERNKPTYEFDATLVISDRISPLCGVKLWLPIDCHEDARIQISSSSPSSGPNRISLDISTDSPRLVSAIDQKFGLKIEAKPIHIRQITTKPTLKVHGINVEIDHIGSLKIVQQIQEDANAEKSPKETFTSILFCLSDLIYGSPQNVSTTDFKGNRNVEILCVRRLKMKLSTGIVEIELHKHWNWQKDHYDRLVAGNFPALEIKKNDSLEFNQLEMIQKLGRETCLLLTLAARHLTVVHVIKTTTEKHLTEEWFYPLNRQRSTTEEKANGPLIDENFLEDYFFVASDRWSTLTDQQQDAIRLAIFSIHPFVLASSEGSFLRMFAALEGLAKTWFPQTRKIYKKIEQLITTFKPQVEKIWPIVDNNNDGLDAIRNILAHGGSMSGQQTEALLVGTDHLQVWLERILLAILHYSYIDSSRDWLSRNAANQIRELPRLRSIVKQASKPEL